MKRALAACLLLAIAPLGLAQDFSSLEERMSAAEFRAAGLDKLSPAELAALNEWLRGKQSLASAAAAAPAYEDRRGFAPDSELGDIRARVVGRFRGWSGKGDRIELDNGQVWETITSNTRLAVDLESPSVTISSGMLNAWFLQVEGYNAKARVKRIK